MWNATHIKKVSKSISMIEYFFILLELAWRVEREITAQKTYTDTHCPLKIGFSSLLHRIPKSRT